MTRAATAWVAAAVVLVWPGGRTNAQNEPAEERVSEQRVDLFVGEQTVISGDSVESYSEGTAGIVDVRLVQDGSSFVLVALAPGTTTLLLLMKDGRRQRYTITVRLVRVSERDNVRLDFYFVQLSRDYGSRIGVGWPGTIGGSVAIDVQNDLQARTITSATATVAAQVLPRIDLAQRSGWARILRQASVVMANGETGMFETGGELNFRVESALSSTIQQITFGSRIEIQPHFDRTTGRLDLRVKAVVSELTAASSEGLPGRTVTNLETLVNLELGQSMIVAGVHSRSSGRQREGLPLLSNIPVLGYLFGTRTVIEEETENLIFIVPSIVEAMPSEKRDLVLEAWEAYRNFDGDPGDALHQRGFADPARQEGK